MAYFELGWTQPQNEVVGCSGTNLVSWIHEQSDSSQWLDIKEPHDGGFQGLRKVRGNGDQCEGMTVIVSFRAWCLQVRVIREVHFPPLSVGVDVCTLWRAVFQAGLSSRLQRCGCSTTSKCDTWKAKVWINKGCLSLIPLLCLQSDRWHGPVCGPGNEECRGFKGPL